MKRTIGTVLMSVLMTLGVLVIMGQGRDDWRYGGFIAGKIAIRDSLRVQNGFQVNGGLLRLATSVADTGAFTTTAVRAAVYISGALATDKYIVTDRVVLSSAETVPVAGNLLAYMAKADTLLVLRAAGTTSGQKFSYVRIKSN